VRQLTQNLRPLISEELEKLYIELIKLQYWCQETNQRIAIIFEGRDTAGKGGAVFAFSQFLNPRGMKIVALPKPTEQEKGQWYFQRYIKELPNPGQIVFFDRSWYNRAVVEPVMGFCSDEEYDRFMKQVVTFERMIIEDGIILIKFWFSINMEEQKRRLEERKVNPLKRWKLSRVDRVAQEKWETYTQYKTEMFTKTSTKKSPWIIVNGNNKTIARIEAIRYVLSMIDYEGKGEETGVSFKINPDIIRVFQESFNADWSTSNKLFPEEEEVLDYSDEHQAVEKEDGPEQVP
jgi:polyphosphate kinase 2